ncbi:putative domain HDIG-containing protein [Desulfitobacterium dehalogenans ATCC 51507]|uniref:Putative domain HDIG-containing protein n=1 Tax=Desulfitobacterium dehalogenans (strain ATCC 51507 / DSM 9161 / JW/IU-DC1) TaxID=756499 RepID=I4A8X9_DESDJ|nr:HD domain-containing protein [Desulfitobacterium dehalogenans]AFM00414.1 putative domain HDIG-containing protein [Desulfitobacterium dehalogenans ATCC 51507]
MPSTTFQEIDNHLLNDNKPSNFIIELSKRGIFERSYPFTLLGALKNTPQSPKYHPEGSVWNHTLMVLDNAAERKHISKNPQVFMWAALLHDLGKAPTTRIRKGRITSYDHDSEGEKLASQFLRELTQDEMFIRQVAKMVRWHMQILFVVKGLPFANVKKMASEVSVEEIALLGFCDRLGRGEMTEEKKQEEEQTIEKFLVRCMEILQF